MLTKYLEIQPEISQALKEDKPIVALESTIISHGMPYPENLKTAQMVEKTVRDQGAIPATIAILEGKIKVGLSAEELSQLAQVKDVKKVSRRDFPYIVANKMNGATTVAATMIVANMAGISLFVTGGIGGVHRGADQTFDVSADLTELSQTNVAVVCAGVKSILDIGSTLEYLETLGVPVMGYQTLDFPAFYTRKSGFQTEYQFKDAADAANTLKTKWDLGLKGGLIIANPIPEQYQMDPDVINQAIQEALKQADDLNVKGKDITPFLLSKIAELTGANSLASNVQLIINNAKVGGQIAKQFVELKK
ncbi:MAG: pseudouridine-5'-phosphate glycosidase [Deltaproteobacteria bacterium]|jgi:pseudouridylate synthase|nr:pseudouridine-5'-phosphate glycosidase [Deltaproteobacteria bacterium]